VVFSYQRQLPEFAPLLPESLSPSEQDEMQVSQRELGAFFRALYQCAYDHPTTFGLPTVDDVYVDQGDSKEKKQDVARQTKKPRDKMVHAVDFLYHIGRQGMYGDRQLRLAKEDYDAFFAKSPRVKQKLVKGMQSVGLTVSEQADAVVVANEHYPHMMLALKPLAEACAQRDDNRLSTFLFAHCDLRALDANYEPDPLDMLQAVLSPAEYERAVEVHHTLVEMAYKPSIDIGGVHSWRIRYQGNRAIKGTALVEFEYDERQRHPLLTRVRCVSTNRLVPLLAQQSPVLQQDFYRHAHSCGAPKCSWCKTRKALGPSVLEYGGEKRTICWYMQRRFTEVNGEAVTLVKHYALLHEALLPA
jgi:hypothetical protein